MYDFEDDDASRREKCYTTVAQLPAYIDPKQPPMKKSPFSAIWGHSFAHTVEVILPENIYDTIKGPLSERVTNPRYVRVFMSLPSLLEGDFFNKYIKTGNILMISEGRSGSDNVFTLRNGTLKLELGKEWYERTGLPGKPIRSGGRKHSKERYLVELNLRLPSMLHGKKGFERIVWAFKNVLNHSVSWLFCDLASQPEQAGSNFKKAPIESHHPQIVDCSPALVRHPGTLAPPIEGTNLNEDVPEEDLRDRCDSLCEWLALVSLDSPRVSADDSIDPYLSRYEVPNADEAAPSNPVSIKWHGLIPSQWITQLFIFLLKETGSGAPTSPAWFALASSALGRSAVEGKDGYMILTLPSARPSSSEPQEPAASGTTGETSESTSKSTNHRGFVCWEYIGASILT